MRNFKRCYWCGKHSLEPSMAESFRNNNNGLKGVISQMKKIGEVEYFENEEEKANARKDIMNETYVNWVRDSTFQKCHFCKKEMFIQFSQKKSLEFAYAAYEEFVEFMDNVDLPEKILINICNTESGAAATCHYDEGIGLFVVEIDTRTTFAGQFKDILFHEFAHILVGYDPLTGGKKIPSDGSNIIMRAGRWYSEYRSSEIELMQSLGFKSISDKHTIRPSKKIVHLGKVIPVADFFMDTMEWYKNNVFKELEKTVTFETAVSIVTNIMYYRGKMSFCKRYFNKDFLDLLPDADAIDTVINERFNIEKNNILRDLLIVLDKCVEKAFGCNNLKYESSYGVLIDDIVNAIFMFLIFNYADDYVGTVKNINYTLRESECRFRRALEGVIDYE